MARFQPGQSGNPGGRAKSLINKQVLVDAIKAYDGKHTPGYWERMVEVSTKEPVVFKEIAKRVMPEETYEGSLGEFSFVVKRGSD